MRTEGASYVNISPRLALTFAVLVILILGGNALVIWQFQVARLQTDRLTGVSQQVIAVLRLQESLLSFHHRLDELVKLRDEQQLVAEAETLRRALMQQTQAIRSALRNLPPSAGVDQTLLPTVEAIEIALPSQLEAISALARTGDWEAVALRLTKELKPLERQTSVLIKTIDQEVSREMGHAVSSMRNVQRGIFVLVPTTAILTFFIAAFFAWAITRRMVELRLQERVEERTRIARDLHDTLLQGLISATMQLHLAIDQVPESSHTKPLFQRILQVMAQVIEEGRNAVSGFRSVDTETQDLERAFSRLPQQLNLKQAAEFRVIVEGRPQLLHPVIRDEVYSIGREALINSFRHSGARRIEVALQYSTHLRVLVRDDGCGIDAPVLQGGRDGHWGLSGMRERAEKIGGKLRVMSRAGSGTEVELRIRGDVAFENNYSRPPRWLTGFYRRRAARRETPTKQTVG